MGRQLGRIERGARHSVEASGAARAVPAGSVGACAELTLDDAARLRCVVERSKDGEDVLALVGHRPLPGVSQMTADDSETAQRFRCHDIDRLADGAFKLFQTEARMRVRSAGSGGDYRHSREAGRS